MLTRKAGRSSALARLSSFCIVMQTNRHSFYSSRPSTSVFRSSLKITSQPPYYTRNSIMPSQLPTLRFHLLTSIPKSANLSLLSLNRRRLLSTTPAHPFPSQSPSPSPSPSELPFRAGPSPPRLPREEQDLFETLQRQSTGAFSTPRNIDSPHRRPPSQINQSPDFNTSDIADAESVISNRTAKLASSSASPPNSNPTPAEKAVEAEEIKRVIEARGTGAELHPAVRRGATPEFEGDINPKTGEVGGPKNEPLRWGSEGEWSYNGRTTDF